MAKDLQFSIALIEHDKNDDDLCTWNFPFVPPIIQQIVVKRSAAEGVNVPFLYYKYKTDWIYSLRSTTDRSVSPQLNAITLCVVSKIFNPEKFNSLLQILTAQYLPTGDPTKILEGSLSVITTGNYSNRAGTFDMTRFRDEEALTTQSAFKELLSMFDATEVVILWNAVLLKKRILILNDSLSPIFFTLLRTLPLLAAHRKDPSVLRPLVTSDPEHLEDLSSSGVFIAGTVDDSLLSRSDLFDVQVSLSERRVNIAPHASNHLRMCSVHKDLSAALSQGMESGSSESDLLQAVAQKTSSILNNLRTLAGRAGGKLSEAVLQESVSNEAARVWLGKVATAEGLM